MYSRFWRSAVLMLAMCLIASAKEKQPKVYPEHGTIISTKTSEHTETDKVRTDNNGKIHGGGSSVSYLPVYRIETETKFYELKARSGRDVFSVSDVVQFRIENGGTPRQLTDAEDAVVNEFRFGAQEGEEKR